MIKPILILSSILLSLSPAETVSVVSNGKAREATTTGKWTTTTSGLTSTGTTSFLSSKMSIARGDFHLVAKLQLATLDGTAAGLVINKSFFGFDSREKKLFTEGPLFGKKTTHLSPASNHFKPNQPFQFEIIRKATSTRILINGETVQELDNWNPETTNLRFRPWRNTLSIKSFTIEGDFIAPPVPEGRAIFSSGDGRYHTYRIPALVTSKKGTLLAFAEGRESMSDHGNLDIVLRRSTDHGKTWNDLQVVRDKGKHQAGNPAPLIDHDTGRIFLFHCTSENSEGQVLSGTGSREVELMHSDDDGITWSAPRNISAMTKKEDWRWYAVGPCSGIQIKTGKHRGRLVVPANHSIHFDDGRKWEYRCHSLISDDHGETWQMGESSVVGASETQIAEVAPDLLIQDIRMQTHRKPYRAVRFSKDGALTWTPLRNDLTRIDPRCQGSMISILNKDGAFTLYSSNPADLKQRKNMQVYKSDNAHDWKEIKILTKGPAAYSDLTFTSDGHLACLYEAGVNNPYESIVFAKFTTP
ncbi:sialidase family protein [Verrucomicrobiaceae bacterium 227]